MAEGRRFTIENPSPTMVSFATYIREKEGEDFVTDAQVAATFIHHRDWQQGHASELATERAAAKEKREAEQEQKKIEREAKKKEKDEAKALKEAEAAQKKAEKEAAKAAKEAEGQLDGDDSDSAPSNGEGQRTRRRLNTKEEPVAAGVSESSF